MVPAQTIKAQDIATIEPRVSWMDEILHYKKDGALPNEPTMA